MIVVILSIVGVIGCILLYTTINLLKKNEKQEDVLASYLMYLDKISRVIEISDNRLKEVDTRGTFKSDDEVGFFFEEISQLQGILNDFKLTKIK
jgi:hypothetical protein|tara:strand:+ start:351 stop:632 length:282 start_codon:yes stop_codon:yes gene_type:complete